MTGHEIDLRKSLVSASSACQARLNNHQEASSACQARFDNHQEASSACQARSHSNIVKSLGVSFRIWVKIFSKRVLWNSLFVFLGAFLMVLGTMSMVNVSATALFQSETGFFLVCLTLFQKSTMTGRSSSNLFQRSSAEISSSSISGEPSSIAGGSSTVAGRPSSTLF